MFGHRRWGRDPVCDVTRSPDRTIRVAFSRARLARPGALHRGARSPARVCGLAGCIDERRCRQGRFRYDDREPVADVRRVSSLSERPLSARPARRPRLAIREPETYLQRRITHLTRERLAHLSPIHTVQLHHEVPYISALSLDLVLSVYASLMYAQSTARLTQSCYICHPRSVPHRSSYATIS